MGILWSLLDKLLTHVISFLVVIFLARELSPVDFGLVGMLAIFVSVAEMLINGGFSSALIQKKDKVDVDYNTVFYINLGVSIFLYIVLFFFSPVIADFYNVQELTLISRVLFVSLLINALSLVPNTKLTIELNFKAKSKINLFALAISSIFSIYFALAGYGVWTLVFQVLIRSTLTLLGTFYVCNWKPKLNFSKDSFDQLFGFGSKLLFTGIIATVVNNLYSLLIGKYFSAKDVGYFTQGKGLAEILAGLVTSVLQSTTYPIMTAVQDDKERLLSIYKRVLNMTAFITLPVMVGFAMISNEFVIVFLTEKWLPAVPVIQWLCLAMMFLPISSLNLSILLATGRSDLFLKVDLSKLPLNLSVLILTIPIGIEAVVIGKFITMLVAFLMNTYYPGKLYGYGVFEQLKDMLPVIFSTVAMAFGLWLIDINVPLYDLMVSIPTGAIIYLAASYIQKVESLKELLVICSELLKNKKNRRL